MSPMLPLLALLAAPVQTAHPAPACGAEEVRIKTTDGWTLAGLYCKPKKGKPVAVLAHGLASGKGEWDKFTPELWKLGWGTLALDLRGHAGSTSGPAGPSDYVMIDSYSGWPQACRDIEAGISFLNRDKKVPSSSRVVLIGASMGANLAAQVFIRTPGLRAAVLLSPGEDYRGVILPRSLGRKVLVGASPSDPYAYQTLVGLAARMDGATLLKTSNGHGVQMLDDGKFLAALLDWLRKKP